MAPSDPAPQPPPVTDLIRRLGEGEAIAEQVLPLIYDELRVIASRLFARHPSGHTLQATAVVHEAWLKLRHRDEGWDGRRHFFAVAARAMRQVLADHARARRTARRGEGWRRLSLDTPIGRAADYDVVDIDEALSRLAAANERHARVVELRVFGGLKVEEAAEVLGIATRTVKLDWRAARAWLRHALEGPEPS